MQYGILKKFIRPPCFADNSCMGFRFPLKVALWLCLFLAAAAVVVFGEVSAFEFGASIKAQLSYDPLTGIGTFSKNGRFATFAVDRPYIVLGWNAILRAQAPYSSAASLILADDTAKAIQNYLSEGEGPQKEKYRVAAILIDPGHGGKDAGAVAEVNGKTLMEKTITLSVAQRVVDLLASSYPGRKVLITRNGDSYPSLEDRVAMANSVDLEEGEAVIYVSIHANASFASSAKGFEVWYLNPEYRRTVVDASTVREKGSEIAPILNAMLEEEFTTESIILARKVYDRLGASLEGQSKGRGIRAEEWFVVRNANMPSILIEMGFITNTEEGRLLADPAYLRKIGDSIYNGIVDFIEHFER